MKLKGSLTLIVAGGSPSFTGMHSGPLEENGFRVIGEAADGRDAVQVCRHLKPDIAILDLAIPGLSGMDAAREIKLTHPDIERALVFRHSSDGKNFAAERVGQQVLQGSYLAPSAFLHRLHDTRLESANVAEDDMEINGRIILLTIHAEKQYILLSLRAGILGHVTKTKSASTLVEAIDVVCRGETYVRAGDCSSSAFGHVHEFDAVSIN